MWMAALGIAMAFFPYALVRGVRPRPRQKKHVDPALVIDLFIASLRSGASIEATMDAVGKAVGDSDLSATATALKKGKAWEEAWGQQQSSQLAQALQASWKDGVDPQPLLAWSAQRIRSKRSTQAKEAAERLGVRLVLPLGLCYLPAFVCFGIIPVVMGGAKLAW